MPTRLLAVAIALTCCAPINRTTEPSPDDTRIGQLIQMIKSTPGSRARYDLGNEMLHAVFDADKTKIGDGVIDDLISLLEVEDVMSDAAGALGIIGPRARSAIPALEKALLTTHLQDEAVAHKFGLYPESSAGDAICPALKKIGAVPEPPLCSDGLYVPRK